MHSIERAIEVDVPASTAYNVWTQFELFPAFIQDVEEVQQLDDRRLHWKAKVFGQTEEWDAEITEQIPDKRIAWRSVGGPANAGVVTFHRLDDDHARVMLQMSYETDQLKEKVADALGLLSHRVDQDLRQFKSYVEKHGDDVAGWRGEIAARPDSRQKGAG